LLIPKTIGRSVTSLSVVVGDVVGTLVVVCNPPAGPAIGTGADAVVVADDADATGAGAAGADADDTGADAVAGLLPNNLNIL